MGIVEAIFLGFVQGLTEFLPVSSTAHLRIIPSLMGLHDPGAAFTASIQLGTLLAVLLYFRNELLRALQGWLGSLTGKGFDRTEARMGWAIVIGTIPIVVCGLVFKKHIENEWRSLTVVAASLILIALVLLAAEMLGKRLREEKDVVPSDGLWVGLWQCLALIPGMSRSGSSIAGAMFLGFDRPAAARFSFLLSVPSVLGAGVYSIVQHRHELLGEMLTPMLVANAVSFITGYASIAILLKLLQKHGTFFFIVYRIALGLLILGLLAGGALKPDAGMESDSTKASASLTH